MIKPETIPLSRKDVEELLDLLNALQPTGSLGEVRERLRSAHTKHVNDFVNLVLGRKFKILNEETPPKVQVGKIYALKAYRAATGCSLREAKLTMDDLETTLSPLGRSVPREFADWLESQLSHQDAFHLKQDGVTTEGRAIYKLGLEEVPVDMVDLSLGGVTWKTLDLNTPPEVRVTKLDAIRAYRKAVPNTPLLRYAKEAIEAIETEAGYAVPREFLDWILGHLGKQKPDELKFYIAFRTSTGNKKYLLRHHLLADQLPE